MSPKYPFAYLALILWSVGWMLATDGDGRVGLAVLTSYLFGRIMGYMFPDGFK
jgi:hypothetical protein